MTKLLSSKAFLGMLFIFFLGCIYSYVKPFPADVFTSNEALIVRTELTKPNTGTRLAPFKMVYKGTPIYDGKIYNSLKNGILPVLGGPATLDQQKQGDPAGPCSRATLSIWDAYIEATTSPFFPYLPCEGLLSMCPMDFSRPNIINCTDMDAPTGDKYTILIKGLTKGWTSIMVEPGMNKIQFEKFRNALK